MPRLDRAREIFNSTTLFELSPVAGAKKIHELADDLYYASENLFKTIDEEFSEEKKKKTSIKQEDFTNRDLKLKDFRRQLDEFLAGLDPKEKKYATLFKYGNKIGTLLDEEVKANEKLLQDFLDKKLKPDAPEEEADSGAFPENRRFTVLT